MHRFALVLSVTLALVALSATTASANTTVLHFKGTIPYTLTHPAGGICDFTFVDSGTIDYNQIVTLDASGDPILEQVNETQYNTHTNIGTGYTLTDVDHFTNHLNYVGGTVLQTGLFWHLRDASGHIVLVQAGEILFDGFTGQILRISANINPDAAAVICPALGGTPVI